LRISPETSQILLNALNASDRAEQAALQQMSTGKRVNQASDDPAAAAMEVDIAAQMDGCDQYLRSIGSLSSELQTTDSSLNSVVTALQRAITLGTEGANGTMSSQDRETLAEEVKGIAQQVLGVANLSYNGHYVFAGTADAEPPYVADDNGNITYQGNDAVNTVEVETGQSVAVNQPGSALFSATGANVFQALNNLVTEMQDPSTTTDDIGNATTAVRTAYDQLNSARSFYGSTLDQLQSSQDFLNSEQVQLSSQQDSTIGADLNTAAANLTSAEEARNAAVQAAASMNGMTLMDYISPATA